jgi:multidrug efflux pump subunit AcrA (membrane-fusion protein)|tara:strand:+ start:69 stop:1001 length:933 start_codon:yes stop_codon:yes gene_type:complete
MNTRNKVCALVAGAIVVLAGGIRFGYAQQLPVVPRFKLSDCNVALVEEVEVAAQFPGVLISLDFKEGDSVTKDQILARIDDSDALIKRKELNLQLAVAEKEASNDINVRAAEASAEVAGAELKESIAVNAESPGAVPPTKIRREELTFRRAELQIDVAKLELDVAKLNVDVKSTQLDNADLTIDRLKVKAPLNAEVERKLKDVGEFVQIGDPIVQLVRMDKLRIEGFVQLKQFLPQLIHGQPVTIEYSFVDPTDADNPKKSFTFTGKVSFVSNKVQAGGEYKIWAEVVNQKYKNQWILRPGVAVDMSIGQ